MGIRTLATRHATKADRSGNGKARIGGSLPSDPGKYRELQQLKRTTAAMTATTVAANSESRRRQRGARPLTTRGIVSSLSGRGDGSATPTRRGSRITTAVQRRVNSAVPVRHGWLDAKAGPAEVAATAEAQAGPQGLKAAAGGEVVWWLLKHGKGGIQ